MKKQEKIEELKKQIEKLKEDIYYMEGILNDGPSVHRYYLIQESEADLPKYKTKLASKQIELRKLQGS